MLSFINIIKISPFYLNMFPAIELIQDVEFVDLVSNVAD
jgi:hypothetical protein